MKKVLYKQWKESKKKNLKKHKKKKRIINKKNRYTNKICHILISINKITNI